MKAIIASALVILLTAFAIPSFAHERHQDEVAKKDSVVQSAMPRQHDSAMMHVMEEHKEMKDVDAFPNYHPLIVHFPIVLLIIATFIQLFSFFVFKKELSWVALVLLALGAITAWLSSNTFHAHPVELTGKAKEIFDTHEQMATLTWWFSLTALIGKVISEFFLNRKQWVEIIVFALLIVSAVAVSIAGHHGAMMVHMKGIGPKGEHLESHEHHHEE